jgi:acyl transferase domain-containing protein
VAVIVLKMLCDFTQVVMMLERKQILPNGYFKKPSAKIDFEKFNLRIPVAVEQFVPYSSKEGLIASISSFGFGGECLQGMIHLMFILGIYF